MTYAVLNSMINNKCISINFAHLESINRKKRNWGTVSKIIQEALNLCFHLPGEETGMRSQVSIIFRINSGQAINL